MSKKLKVLAFVAIAAVALMSVVSCAGPAGANGTDGPAGPAGPVTSGGGSVTAAVTDYTTLGGVQSFLPQFITTGQLNQGPTTGQNGFFGVNAWTYDSLTNAVQKIYKAQATIITDSTTPGGYAVTIRSKNLSSGTSVAWNKFFSGITVDALYKVTASIKRLTAVTAAQTTAGTLLEFQADNYDSTGQIGEFSGQQFVNNGFTGITFPTAVDTTYSNYSVYATGFAATRSNLWIGFFEDQQPLNYNIGSVTLTTVPLVGADQDWTDAAKGLLKLNGSHAAVTTNADLTLPATITPAAGGNAVSIAWASSNDAIVDHTTGAVTTLSTASQTATLTATLTFGSGTSTVVFAITVPQAYNISAPGDTQTFTLGLVPNATGITGINNFSWDGGGTNDVQLNKASSGWTLTLPRKANGDLAYSGFSFKFAKVFLANSYDIEVDVVGSPVLWNGLILGDVGGNTITALAAGKFTVTNYTLASNGPIFIGKNYNNDAAYGTNFTGGLSTDPSASIKINKVVVKVH